jgi:hypothetical protein
VGAEVSLSTLRNSEDACHERSSFDAFASLCGVTVPAGRGRATRPDFRLVFRIYSDNLESHNLIVPIHVVTQ